MNTKIQDLIEKILEPYTVGRNIKTSVGTDLSTILGLVKANQFLLGLLIKEIGILHQELKFLSQKNENLDRGIKETKILIRQTKPTVNQEEGTSQTRPKFDWYTPEQTDYKKVFCFHPKQ